MRNELNDRVKKREPFRPFAPVILAEKASEYFEVTQADPFMTLAPRVRTEKQSVIPAAVHIDGTGRIQTIDRAANPPRGDNADPVPLERIRQPEQGHVARGDTPAALLHRDELLA